MAIKNYTTKIPALQFGGDCMATRSMLKDVEIMDEKSALDFANALDVALARAESNVSNDTVKRECKELSGEEINKFFNM